MTNDEDKKLKEILKIVGSMSKGLSRLEGHMVSLAASQQKLEGESARWRQSFLGELERIDNAIRHSGVASFDPQKDKAILNG